MAAEAISGADFAGWVGKKDPRDIPDQKSMRPRFEGILIKCASAMLHVNRAFSARVSISLGPLDRRTAAFAGTLQAG